MGDNFSVVFAHCDDATIRAIAAAMVDLTEQFRRPHLSLQRNLSVDLLAARNSACFGDLWWLELRSDARSAGAATQRAMSGFGPGEKYRAVHAFLKECALDWTFALASVVSEHAGKALYIHYHDGTCASAFVELAGGKPQRARSYGIGGSEDLVTFGGGKFMTERRSLQAGDFGYESPALDELAAWLGRPMDLSELYDHLLPGEAPDTFCFNLSNRDGPVRNVSAQRWRPSGRSG
jgi:hypothetical protein